MPHRDPTDLPPPAEQPAEHCRPGGAENRPLRVAYVLTQDRGGPVDVTVQLAAALVDTAGVEVRVFGPVPARGAGEIAGLLEESDVESKTAVGPMRAARRRILDWRPDVVHAQDRRSGLLCAALRRPVVHTYHGVPDDVADEWLRGGPGPRPPRYTMAVLTADAAVARAVRRTVVVSPVMAEFLTGRLHVPADKIVHIDNGLRLQPALPVRPPVRRLLFVGLLVARKGVHHLLEALADPRLPADLTLQVAGDGPELGALQARAVELGLDGRVEFLGFRDDVGTLLAASDAFVLPSLLEQQPLVLIEAMGAGLPCVATDVGGVADLLGPDGIVVPPRSPEALADGLVRLLAADVTDLGRRAAVRARSRFSVETSAARHLDLYRSLL